MAGSSGLPQTGVELVAEGLSAFQGTLDKGNDAVHGFTQKAAEMGDKTSGVSEIVTGALRHIGDIAVDSLLKAGQAVIGFGQDSLKLAGDFDQGMQQFRVAAGTQLDDSGFQQFHDLFLQLGKDLPVSTSEVQQAAIEMVKGGLDPATLAAGGLKQNIQFAAAAMNGDLAGAATISAKIVAGWSDVNATAADKANLLSHATDLLTKAANASSVDVHELSLGLFNVQATAKNAGIGIDDVTTVLAELSGDFASSAEAGNSLANFINRLHPTTKAATEAMESLGLVTKDGGNAFYDAQGNFVGFQKASEILQESLKGLNNEQRQQIMQTIFQKDAMGVAAGLASRGADGYRQMAEQLGNAMGVAEAGTTVQQGYNTAVENAMGGLEALKITIGEKLLPIMTDFFNFLNNTVLSNLITFTDAIFGNDEAFKSLDPTLQGIVSTIDVVVADVQDLVGIFSDAGAGSSEFGEQIGLIAQDFGLAADPVENIVFLVQDIVKSFQSGGVATQDFSGVLTDLTGIWVKLQTTFMDVMTGYQQIAQAVLPILTKFYQDHATEIESFLQGAYTHIMTIVNTALDLYDAVVPKVLETVAKWIEQHATGIQAVLSGAWQAISAIIDGALTLIEGVFKVALDLINGNWSKAWEDLKAMCAGIVLDLQQLIHGFLDIIAGFFNTSLNDIITLWENNWNNAVDIVTRINWVDAGKSVVEGIIKGVEDMASSLFASLEQMAQDAYDAFMRKIKGGSPAIEFVPAGQSIMQGIMLGIENELPTLTDQIGGIADGLLSQMEDIGKKVQDAIADSFSADASIDRQMVSNLDKLKDVLPQYLDYVKGALKQVQDEAMAFEDPKMGADYFRMRSNQILEYAKLQKKLSEATTDEDKRRIEQQMLLTNRAQQSEIEAFNAKAKASKSAAQTIMDQINAIMMALSKINLTDDQIKLVDALATIMDALRGSGGPSRADMYAHPEQYAPPSTNPAARGPTTNTTTTTNTFHMPVYTDNSLSTLQRSLAVITAGAF